MITNAAMERVYEFRCLSGDTKPTEGIDNGTFAIEMDTGKIYVFDYEHKAWLEFK